MLQTVASLIDDARARVALYNCNMFIIQVTEHSQVEKHMFVHSNIWHLTLAANIKLTL